MKKKKLFFKTKEKLFQSRFDTESVVSLTRSLFEHSLFETLIISNVLLFFEAHADEASTRRAFVSLVADYLLAIKRVLHMDVCVEMRQAAHAAATSSDSFAAAFARTKALAHLMRVFGDKSSFGSSRLRGELVVDFENCCLKSKEEESPSSSSLVESLLCAPFVLAGDEVVTRCTRSLVDNTMRSVGDKAQQALGLTENSSSIDELCTQMERDSFRLSVAIWSLTMMRDENDKEDKANANRLLIDSLAARLLDVSRLSSSHVVTTPDAKQHQVLSTSGGGRARGVEHTTSHLLRAFAYTIAVADENNNNNEDAAAAKSVRSLLKSQLSSPYHEVRLNALSVLAHTTSKQQVTSTSKDNENGDNNEKKTSGGEKFANLFEICLKAEQTPASLDEYRQKLFYLQLLDATVCGKYFDSESTDSEEAIDNDQDVR